MFTKQQNNRRYRLHRLAKKAGCPCNARQRAVGVPYGTNELPPPVAELLETYKYHIQLIFKF